jgi:hypothetical protein
VVQLFKTGLLDSWRSGLSPLARMSFLSAAGGHLELFYWMTGSLASYYFKLFQSMIWSLASHRLGAKTSYHCTPLVLYLVEASVLASYQSEPLLLYLHNTSLLAVSHHLCCSR